GLGAQREPRFQTEALPLAGGLQPSYFSSLSLSAKGVEFPSRTSRAPSSLTHLGTGRGPVISATSLQVSRLVGQEVLNSNHPAQSSLPHHPPPPSLQVRYGKVWSDYVGGTQGDLEEIFLHPGESVIQVSGKYKYYLRKLVFVTDKGRYLPFGKDTGTSFNAAPLYPNTVLRFISGRSSALINAIGLHWDVYPSDCGSC
uniref:zymogen granule membrane protein 16-like n=1 Tax=Panthera onca TaxID=9690 RepID=UPI0029552B2A